MSEAKDRSSRRTERRGEEPIPAERPSGPVVEVSAGGVVLLDDRIVALQGRGGQWVLPKGHVEPGETPERAAVREVREETGLRVRVVAPLGTTRYRFRTRDGRLHEKSVHWFLVRPVGGRLQVGEPFRQVARLEAEEALRRLTYANERAMVRRALAHPSRRR